MHHRRTIPAGGDRAGPGQERGLTDATFVGSFPAADFRLQPRLPEIGLLGRSNVGKSTLLNVLVGRRRLARTSRAPGKTRMCNVYRVGDRFYLVDLPGYGYARASKVERRRLRSLIEAYLSSRRTLSGVVWLLDVRREPSPDDRAVAQVLATHHIPVLAAITKADKLGRARRGERARAILQALAMPDDQCVLTSARTREGVDRLREAIMHFVERPRHESTA